MSASSQIEDLERTFLALRDAWGALVVARHRGDDVRTAERAYGEDRRAFPPILGSPAPPPPGQADGFAGGNPCGPNGTTRLASSSTTSARRGSLRSWVGTTTGRPGARPSARAEPPDAAEAVIALLQPLQKRYAELAADPGAVALLDNGVLHGVVTGPDVLAHLTAPPAAPS